MEDLGPTGKFPKGKLNEDDEGELAFSVFVKAENVIINFNTPVHWIAMLPAQAEELAFKLIKYAEKIKGKDNGGG